MDIKLDMRSIIYGEMSVEANYNGNTIRCIFNNESKAVREDEEGMVIDTVPSALFIEDDVQGITSGDFIEINGVQYRVREVFKLNGGILRILLTEGNLYD